MGKKLIRLKNWLVDKHRSAVDTQDYTREMAFREVICKLEELKNERH